MQKAPRSWLHISFRSCSIFSACKRTSWHATSARWCSTRSASLNFNFSQRNFSIVISCTRHVSSAGLPTSNKFKHVFCARSREQIAAGADLRRLIPTLTPACVAHLSSSFKFEISESGSRAGAFVRKRVSRGDIHSIRAGSTIGSPAYVGRFEWSTYVGRLPAPSLKTNFGVSPRDQAKVCQKKCREDTRTASGFVIARKKYFSMSSRSAFGLRLNRIDLNASSFQCLPSANENRSTSLSQFGFVHTHLRVIRRASTCGDDATEPLRTAHARPRAAAAAPRTGGRANATVAPSRFAKPRRVQKTRLVKLRILLNFGVKNYR